MPDGKRYKPVKSAKQRAMLFHLAEEGKLPMSEARGKAHAAKVKAARTGKPLPERVPKRQR